MRAKLAGHDLRMRACADDLRSCVDSVLSGLFPFLHPFAMLERAIDFCVNIGKCRVLVVGSLNPGQFIAHLRRKVSAFQDLGLVRVVLYLRCWMGPGAMGKSRSNAIP
eukprot:7539301-Pyramimonas_sp.AAC.2